MYSMTGFGKAEYKNGYEITVEIKTVNNRFLDVLPKYPKSFVAYDDLIRKTVQSKITRGRVELFFSFSLNKVSSISCFPLWGEGILRAKRVKDERGLALRVLRTYL